MYGLNQLALERSAAAHQRRHRLSLPQRARAMSHRFYRTVEDDVADLTPDAPGTAPKRANLPQWRGASSRTTGRGPEDQKTLDEAEAKVTKHNDRNLGCKMVYV